MGSISRKAVPSLIYSKCKLNFILLLEKSNKINNNRRCKDSKVGNSVAGDRQASSIGELNGSNHEDVTAWACVHNYLGQRRLRCFFVFLCFIWIVIWRLAFIQESLHGQQASWRNKQYLTDPKTIQEILGHSNFKTTEIYLHLIKGSDQEAMNRLDSSLTGFKNVQNF